MLCKMSVKILEGPCIANLASLDSESIQCVVTSPPYFQCRTYGDHTQEIGRESSPDDYIASLMQVLGEIRRVLKDDGVVWVNIGDVFAKKNYPETAMHPKIRKGEAMLLPYMFAMEARRGGGWYVQQDVIWAKRNPIPSSTPKRCTPSHEHIWMLTKSDTYAFDPEPIMTECKTPGYDKKPYGPMGGVKRAGGDNAVYSGNRPLGTGKARKRDVWFETTSKCPEAHFAPFPESIVEPCILATTREGDTVLDPFSGTGTTGVVSKKLKRDCVCIELYPTYVAIMKKRLRM